MGKYRFDIIQQTPEWFEAKKLKMGASHASVIMANGKGLDTYVKELLADYYSEGEKEIYTNADIQRGIDLEPLARELYSIKTGNDVVEVGGYEYDKYTFVSPDGLVSDDGGVEIKCHNDKVFVELLLHEVIDPKYIAQIQMNLFCTGRKWWDYIGYNQNIKPYIYIKRIEPDLEAFEKIEEGLKTGKKLILQYKKKLDKWQKQ